MNRILVFALGAGLAPAARAAEAPANNGAATLALFVVVAAVAAWLALRAFVRSMRVRKTQSAVGADFSAYALEALVNAAKLDGRVNEAEQRAIANAMTHLTGREHPLDSIGAAFVRAQLSKDELVAYLSARAGAFTRDQKLGLLRALLAVFVADGTFDQSEHAALVDYTEAVGFDRQTAPEKLSGLAGQLKAGNIV